VYRARTTHNQNKHRNQANAKHKKLQAEPAEIVHRKPHTTTNKHKSTTKNHESIRNASSKTT